MTDLASPLASAWALHTGGAVPPLDAVGGKARNLALLQEAGADVPPWIAIGTAAFERLVAGAHPSTETEADAAAVRERVLALELPADFRAAVTAALDAAGLRGVLLAVRSSAVGEDGAAASFAGQFDTVLGVRAAGDAGELWDAIRRVWASAFSAHAAAYRARQGGLPARMAVVIQQMVDAQAAGVAFSADPVRGTPDVAIVSAVFGLGEGLVSGELDADTYRVSSAGAVEAEIAVQGPRAWACSRTAAASGSPSIPTTACSRRSRTTKRAESHPPRADWPAASARRRTWSGRWRTTRRAARGGCSSCRRVPSRPSPRRPHPPRPGRTASGGCGTTATSSRATAASPRP